jgi:hypothetical protein
MGRACNTNGGEDGCIQDIRGKARRKTPLGRPRHRWVNSVKMDLRKIGWDGLTWVDLD